MTVRAGDGRPHVLQVFQPDNGGVPTIVAGLTEQLTARGWRTSVAGPSTSTVSDRLATAAEATIPLNVGRVPQPRSDGAVIRRLVTYCRQARVELIHAHSTKAGALAGIAARVTGVPCVYSPHAWSFDMAGPRPLRVGYALAERAMSRTCHDAVVVTSEAERASARAHGIVPKGEIHVVYNSVGDAAFRDRRAARTSLGIPAEGVVVAWVGRAGPQKQPEQLVDLAHRLDGGATVVALGRGLGAESLGSSLREAGVRILPEATPADDLYAAADMLVQTSAWEGMPMVILEAMAAGLPIVAYGVGGVAEEVRDGVSGWVIAPDDMDALAMRVKQLVASPDGREAMGAEARARIRDHFGVDATVSRLESVYRQAITGLARPRA